MAFNRNSDWENVDLTTHYPVDLFECTDCEIEFNLESQKIKGKTITCPICQKEIKAWQKEWEV